MYMNVSKNTIHHFPLCPFAESIPCLTVSPTLVPYILTSLKFRDLQPWSCQDVYCTGLHFVVWALIMSAVHAQFASDMGLLQYIPQCSKRLRSSCISSCYSSKPWAKPAIAIQCNGVTQARLKTGLGLTTYLQAFAQSSINRVQLALDQWLLHNYHRPLDVIVQANNQLQIAYLSPEGVRSFIHLLRAFRAISDCKSSPDSYKL